MRMQPHSRCFLLRSKPTGNKSSKMSKQTKLLCAGWMLPVFPFTDMQVKQPSPRNKTSPCMTGKPQTPRTPRTAETWPQLLEGQTLVGFGEAARRSSGDSMSAQCLAAMFQMENACEAAAEPSAATHHTGELRSTAEVPLNPPDVLLVGLVAGTLGAACGGFTGGFTGGVAGVCAAAYSVIGENASTLGVATGFVGSIVGGMVGGAFCGAVGGAVGAVAARRFTSSSCFSLTSDVVLATLGCATGGAIGCSFHRTVGTLGAATGAAFGALAARDFTTRLAESWVFGVQTQLTQILQLLIKPQDKEEQLNAQLTVS